MLDELLLLVFLALAGAGAGAVLSSPLAGLLAGVGAWTVLQFVRLLRLSRWLAGAAPPGELRGFGSAGLWGEVYRRVARLRRAADAGEKDRRRIRLEDGVAALPYGFAVVTRGGRLKWFNAAASDLLHLSHPGDVGREIAHLVRQPDFVAALESGEDGAEVALNVYGKPLAAYVSSFGDGAYRLITVQDLSRVRRLERARSELLGNVAHELKTPLTVIRGYAEIIAAGKSPADGAAAHIGRQAERMNRIVDDLLMLERLEGRPLSAHDVEPVKLRQLADEVAQEAAMIGRANRCRIEVVVDEDATLHGDRSELHSVLSNLVGNAVRYSPEGGVVHVSWSRDGGRLSVSDQGPGIDPAHLPRLTERFYRADKSRSPESGGTGLGLAIVKHVLQRHGASLRIESELGKGSVFHCDFPRQ